MTHFAYLHSYPCPLNNPSASIGDVCSCPVIRMGIDMAKPGAEATGYIDESGKVRVVPVHRGICSACGDWWPCAVEVARMRQEGT